MRIMVGDARNEAITTSQWIAKHDVCLEFDSSRHPRKYKGLLHPRKRESDGSTYWTAQFSIGSNRGKKVPGGGTITVGSYGDERAAAGHATRSWVIARGLKKCMHQTKGSRADREPDREAKRSTNLQQPVRCPAGEVSEHDPRCRKNSQVVWTRS